MGRLNGKVAFITGGSSGIGKAMSYLFSNEGAKVVIADINKEAGTKVVEEITGNGKDAAFVELNVTSEEQWEAAINEAIDHFGFISVVVNGAGIGGDGKSIEETTLSDWDRIIDINLKGVYLGTKHAIISMKNNEKNCSIINLSSIAGLVGDDQLTIYSASKGGVKLLTKSSALHCAKSRYSIRVNSIHPGYIRTPMVDEFVAGDEEAIKAIDAMHPVGHMGEADDIAFAALYLASDESKFVTGSEQVVDGGYTAR
ncbi:MAG TPA: glucose 1-dehydrogenase [Bacillota bacterium]|nr:glucose 1-dehydrogenase [Bacillota bacterium]